MAHDDHCMVKREREMEPTYYNTIECVGGKVWKSRVHQEVKAVFPEVFTV